jgi:hypothetical protein
MVIPRIAALASLLLLTFSFSGMMLSSSPHATPTALPQDESNFTLEGKITEKSAGKLTVSSGENMIFHVLYNDKTEIKKKDGSTGTGQDLRIGVKISVAGDLAESGEITAKKIEIEGESSDKQ